MSQLIADASLPAKLASVTEVVEIVDPSGRKLGKFTPESVAEPLCPWEPTLTKEEIERRLQEPGRSWAEIRERLIRMRPL